MFRKGLRERFFRGRRRRHSHLELHLFEEPLGPYLQHLLFEFFRRARRRLAPGGLFEGGIFHGDLQARFLLRRLDSQLIDHLLMNIEGVLGAADHVF